MGDYRDTLIFTMKNCQNVSSTSYNVTYNVASCYKCLGFNLITIIAIFFLRPINVIYIIKSHEEG